MKAKEILTNIKCIKKCLGKSNETSGNKYRITLKYNNKTVWFIYHDNYMNKSDLNDYIYSLLLDAYSYYCNENDFDGFCWEYGYQTFNPESKEIYRACKKQFERLNKLFNQTEKDLLKKHFENY